MQDISIQVADLQKLQEAQRPKRRRLHGGARQHLRAARLQRRGQDHGRENPVHAAQADAGTASVNGFDVVTQPAQVREAISLTGQFAAVDEILLGGRTSC